MAQGSSSAPTPFHHHTAARPGNRRRHNSKFKSRRKDVVAVKTRVSSVA